MLNTPPNWSADLVNLHERERVIKSIQRGIPLWAQMDLAELLLTSGRCANADLLIESMRERLITRRGLVRDYGHERPVPSHMWDAPPLAGERRLVHGDGDITGIWTDQPEYRFAGPGYGWISHDLLHGSIHPVKLAPLTDEEPFTDIIRGEL
jgi:hypothetical protein